MMRRTFFTEVEKRAETVLGEDRFVVLRFDGHNFRAFTKPFLTPYDYDFMEAMDFAAQSLINFLGGVVTFAYVTSNEISVVLTNYKRALSYKVGQGYPYGGRLQKLLTLSASTVSVNLWERVKPLMESAHMLPVFDGRMLFFRR